MFHEILQVDNVFNRRILFFKMRVEDVLVFKLLAFLFIVANTIFLSISNPIRFLGLSLVIFTMCVWTFAQIGFVIVGLLTHCQGHRFSLLGLSLIVSSLSFGALSQVGFVIIGLLTRIQSYRLSLLGLSLIVFSLSFGALSQVGFVISGLLKRFCGLEFSDLNRDLL